jgi:hypothetical protein
LLLEALTVLLERLEFGDSGLVLFEHLKQSAFCFSV